MNKRVLVAMSGGVDSSVALIKVIEEGFEPIGITMKLWESSDSDGTPSTDSYCCSIEAINNAKSVCNKFNVHHYTIDYKEIFRKNVVDYLVNQYFDGMTPNPCIQCNIHIRWGALFRKANDLEANWVATGHYAQIDKMKNFGPIIRKSMDENKDQSYVLWGIDQKLIKRTLFPIGNLNKKEVRKIAKNNDLITANIKDSQELCFLPNADYRRFLKEYAPNRAKSEKKGLIISTEGETIGSHSGLSKYTIGQRKKLGISGPRPSYVKNMDKTTNTITVAPREKMYFSSCQVSQLNLLVPIDHWPSNEIVTQIRYNHRGVMSKIELEPNGTINVKFDNPQFAVTPGQSAVFYSDNILLGGGIIVSD
tara:strand:+ start:10157 stop:11248 length:1092 start_codon:yes stop_codon:yes gene_type:complete